MLSAPSCDAQISQCFITRMTLSVSLYSPNSVYFVRVLHQIMKKLIDNPTGTLHFVSNKEEIDRLHNRHLAFCFAASSWRANSKSLSWRKSPELAGISRGLQNLTKKHNLIHLTRVHSESRPITRAQYPAYTLQRRRRLLALRYAH